MSFFRNRAGPTLYGLSLFMLVLFIAPFLFPFSITIILINFLVFAALAYSINFITGMTGYVSFGQVIFVAIGAYSLAVPVKVYGVSPVVGILLGAFLGLVFALAIGAVALRFRGVYFAITTLVIELAALNIVLELPQLGGGQGIIMNLGFFPNSWYYAAWAVVLVEIFFTYFLNRGRLGFGIRATRNDEDAARAIGVDATKLKLYLYSVSGLFGGAAGAIFAWSISHVYPTEVFDLTFSLQMLAMIIIGGMGTSIGPILGAFLVYIPSYYLLTVLANSQLIVVGLAVIVIALFIPEGIIGTLRKRYSGLRRYLE